MSVDMTLDKHEEFKKTLRGKKELKRTNGLLTKDELDYFADELDKINKEKEEIRLNTFKKFADEISGKKFQFKVDYYPKKKVYTIEKDASSYYAVKQLQTNINKTFKVKQANRNLIIKQLFYILSDGYPKILIKTDIKSFYESIPQDKLFAKIEDNTLLSPFSKKLIRKLFYEYERKKDTTIIPPKKGIPRGIGVSAYLSELYMRDIDNEMKCLDDVIFFARYVDDIIVIFSPKSPSTKGNYFEKIKDIIVKKNELRLKDGSDGGENKTLIKEFWNHGTYSEEVNFLGYKLTISRTQTFGSNGKPIYKFQTIINISDNKLDKYKLRLRKAVETYNNDSKFNEKEARKLLFQRLKFLTGNFHLNNNKRNVRSGVFYSNSMLTLNKDNGVDSLRKLDKELSKEIKFLIPPPKIGINKTNLILHIIHNYSFRKGFSDLKNNFYSFNVSSKEASIYFKKYGRTVSKFEIITSIWK